MCVSTHLASDLKIRSMLSKNHDVQKNIIWGHSVYNDDLNHYDLNHYTIEILIYFEYFCII